MSAPLRQGRIVWVEMTDPQGRGRKVRPAVVLTPTPQIKPGGTIVVAAVTTQIGMTPAEKTVPLPWHRDPRQSRTGLTEEPEVVCDWLAEVPVPAVQRTSGLVPTDRLLQVIAKVRGLTGMLPAHDAPSGPTPPPPPPPPAQE